MSSEARERWRRVDALVEAALERPPGERPAFLDHACGGDAELRREVESLLDHDRTDDFLESPAASEAARLAGAGEAASLAGLRIGRFEVLGRIGSGGMGEVYEAQDARLQRRVAIKRLPAHLSADADRVRRFRQEALAASALNHPNIVTVHEILEHEGSDLLVTELVDGVTLRERMRDGPLPLASLLDIGVQIAKGLAAAHAIGIVHRDVKPENVMLRSDGLVKLLDFGVAKATLGALAEDDSGTTPGSIVGTIGYMSPEQARGLAVDARSDVWSVGVILYELATGESPFLAPTPTDRLAAILARDPVPPSRRRTALPADFDRLVARALAKDPSHRPADGAELASALAAIGSGAAALAEISATETYVSLAPQRRRHRLTKRAAAVLAAIFAMGLAAAWGAWRFASGGAVDSLAVMPFENRSGDPDSEYIGDGLAESLIDQMSRVASLRVMARSTVFHYKGSPDPLEAGQRLGVGAVLTGSIARRSDRLLVTAELVETRSGLRLWGETYDRPVTELLSVQDSIASGVAGRLRPRLSEGEKVALRRHGTADPEVYDLFLKAQFWFMKDTEEDDLEATRLFQQALERDPKFIEPRLALSVIHSRAAVNGYAQPAGEWAGVRSEMDKVLELDPGNAAAHAQVVNRAFLFEWDFARAEREYREILRNPMERNQFATVLPLCLFFWASGRTDEALALIDEVLAGDPGHPEVRIMQADLLAHSGRLEPALARYRTIIEGDPEDSRAWFGLAEVKKRRGDLAGAIEALRKAYELSDEAAGVEALMAARTEADYERAEGLAARARLAALQELARERYVSPLTTARLHAQLGEREPAFAVLEAAFAERSPGLVFLKVDRAWDRIRDDPRFAELVRRVGIP
ncbi:MAG TPA: protein kinase [Vicinamibacteria bacterium]|nr:protein kinase [Vicinamibacteria bacterium]